MTRRPRPGNRGDTLAQNLVLAVPQFLAGAHVAPQSQPQPNDIALLATKAALAQPGLNGDRVPTSTTAADPVTFTTSGTMAPFGGKLAYLTSGAGDRDHSPRQIDLRRRHRGERSGRLISSSSQAPKRLLRAGAKLVLMSTRRLISLIAAAGALSVVGVSSATAATVPGQQATSENWSGYVASGSASSSQFSSVSGSWIQPTANCSAGDGSSAFWLGLGGAGQQSQALEQTGTQSDCTGGSASYYAWYELVPAGQVRLDLAISPGDRISANVTVSGTNVTVTLSDQTTGASASKTLQMNNPDTTSAEWIAEAPSTCDGSGSCQPLPLADFGSVNFTGAAATANGHTGSISDPNWSAQAVALSGQGAGAAPSGLSTDGSSFSVQADTGQAGGAGATGSGSGNGQVGVGGDTSPGYGGYGYGGYGSGYGYGAYYGSGYGASYGVGF